MTHANLFRSHFLPIGTDVVVALGELEKVTSGVVAQGS
jgi:hypothetical protein